MNAVLYLRVSTCADKRDDDANRQRFNPRVKLTKQEMFLDSVHEIGHLLGLAHNANVSSVRYSTELAKSTTLNASDLDVLAARHKPRPEFPAQGRDGAGTPVSSLI